MRRSLALSFAAVTIAAGFATAASACTELRMVPGGRVVQVTDGDTVVLASGLTVRLIGTQAPKLPLGRENFPPWPLADTAQAALAALALEHEVRLGYGGETEDRYGRALAQLFVMTEAGEVWAQLHMLEAGLARVYSFPDNRQCLDQLFAGEARARTARLGIWANAYYSIRAADRPDELLDRVGHYELVEGRVLLAEQRGGRVYLNFGRFFKEDTTAVIEAPALKLFARDGIDPLVLEGALIRIRGWVDDRDGPRIEITHPEQIEVLSTR